jgi:hypothetical protein
MSNQPITDLDVAVAFLLAVRRHGPWTLVALHPDRVQDPRRAGVLGSPLDRRVQAMPVETFTPRYREQLYAWLRQWNATHGIYWHVNPARTQAFHRRASQFLRKTERFLDIAAFQYVAGDFDPPNGETLSPEGWETKVRHKLDQFDLRPTFVWRSGYGVQATWRVKPAVPLHTNEDVRRCWDVCRGVAEMLERKLKLKSDNVASLDHIFRLPGTINYPNKAKRALGRLPVCAGNFSFDPSAIYDVGSLPKAAASVQPIAHGLQEPPGGWDTPENVANAIMHCQHTRDLAGEGKSQTAWRTALWLRDLGISADRTFAIMQETWAPRCQYEWDDEELRDKVTRAYASAQNDPGCRTVLYRLAQARRDFK